MLTFQPQNMVLEFDPATDARQPWKAAVDHELLSRALWVRIPRGFRCNLASVPTSLMWLAPPNGNHQRAAFFHDALYQLGYTDRTTADAIFLQIMTQDKVPAWRRVGLYLAVRIFGRWHWMPPRVDDQLAAGKRQCADDLC